MCLFINNLELKIADKDIICYKLVKRTKVKGVYKASFQEFEYIIRKLYTNNINVEFVYKLIHSSFSRYYIEEGMFHSYVNFLYPKRLNTPPNWIILKCIIPKGAYYFEGYFSGSLSYASSQIKILEEI